MMTRPQIALHLCSNGGGHIHALPSEVAFTKLVTVDFHVHIIRILRKHILTFLIFIRLPLRAVSARFGSICTHSPRGRLSATGRIRGSPTARLGHVAFRAASLTHHHPPLSGSLFLHFWGMLGSCRCPSNTSA
jgi:hypothetical protein